MMRRSVRYRLALAALAGFSAAGAAASAASGAQAPDELELVASNDGFRPRLLRLRKGDPARIVLSSADSEHCFAVDALRIQKRIVPGRTSVVDVTPDRAGEFPFYCCLEPDNARLTGTLLVAE